jgi:KipI family sensor histidine kinase inhibitor
MRLRPYGPHAWLVEHDDPVGFAAGARAAAASGHIPGLIDVVTAESTVLLSFDQACAVQTLQGIHPLAPTADTRATVELPVVYDGEDVDEVGALTGMSRDEVISVHVASTYRVAFCGFAPGFAYLRGLDHRLGLPRRATPRPRVPAGSVAIAAGYTAVYPLQSPGGWHLLGRTNVSLFDPLRDIPALLRPGMQVRFTPVESLHLAAPDSDGPNVAATTAAPTLQVMDPGMLTLVQDLGRPGHGEMAVSPSGAFDRSALRLANRIVGNTEDLGALEALGPGLTLQALRHATLAITGAATGITLAGRQVAAGAPLTLAPGDVLRIEALESGLRSVIAVRGGIHMPRVMGSCARDTLSGIGPPPLRSGDFLHCGSASGAVHIDHVPLPRPSATVALRLHPGPRHDRLTPPGRTALQEQAFVVAPDSDRIGVRLLGSALALTDLGRLPSEGVVRGALQVPPDGQPVILGPDHPVTGGYPVVAVVDPADVDLLAQASPGTHVRFTLVGW